MVFRTLAFRFLLGVVLVVSTQSAMAQTTQDSIKQTVDRMFLGMKNADSAMVVRVADHRWGWKYPHARIYRNGCCDEETESRAIG